MTVELTIQEMFDKYPTLFKERADCLNHLFCTIGNGYHWKDGELIDIFYELSESEKNLLISRLIDGKAFQYNKLSLRAESQHYETKRIAEGWYEDYCGRYSDEDIEKIKDIRQKTIMKLPDDVYYKEPERKKRWSFYINIPGQERIDFCEKYAYLFNYPDDIKPDWLAALNECRTLLIEDGFNLPK